MMDCLLDCVCEATGIDKDLMIRRIGHDGREVVHPTINPPHCYRGFNPLEINTALIGLNWTMIPVMKSITLNNSFTCLGTRYYPDFVSILSENFDQFLLCNSTHCVLISHNKEYIYDLGKYRGYTPQRFIKEISKFDPQCGFGIAKIS